MNAPIDSGDYGSPIASRYRGTCFICNKPYAIGESIWWSRRLGPWHFGCQLTPAILGPSEPSRRFETIAEHIFALNEDVARLERERAALRARVDLLEKELAEAVLVRVIPRAAPRRREGRRLDS